MTAAARLFAKTQIPEAIDQWLDEFASWFDKQDNTLWTVAPVDDTDPVSEVILLTTPCPGLCGYETNGCPGLLSLCVMQAMVYWQMEGMLVSALDVTESDCAGILPTKKEDRALLACANDNTISRPASTTPDFVVITIRRRLKAILGLGE